jgi:hypothetical protein
MATYRIEKEQTSWIYTEVEADNFEDAITKAEAEENDFNWDAYEEHQATGAYYGTDLETEETFCNQTNCEQHSH